MTTDEPSRPSQVQRISSRLARPVDRQLSRGRAETSGRPKPFERGGRGEREERQKNLKLSALFAPSAFNGLWAARWGQPAGCCSHREGRFKGQVNPKRSRDDCHPNNFSRPLRSRRQGAEVGGPLTERNRMPEFQWPELTQKGHALTLDSRRTESDESGPNDPFDFGPACLSPIWPGPSRNLRQAQTL